MSDGKISRFHSLDDMFDTQVMDTRVPDGGHADTQVLKAFDDAGDAPTRAMPTVGSETPTTAMPAVDAETPTTAMPTAKAAPDPEKTPATMSDGAASLPADGETDGVAADLGDVPLQELAEQGLPGLDAASEPLMWGAPASQAAAPEPKEPMDAPAGAGPRPAPGIAQGAASASANPWGNGPTPPLWQAPETPSGTQGEPAAPTGPSVPTIVLGVMGILVGVIGVICASGLSYGLFAVQRISMQQMTALFCGVLGVLFIAVAVIWGVSRAVSNRRLAKTEVADGGDAGKADK